ncbi:MAG: PIN domain-containing protein [Thermomicrobiales bacterium]
MVILDTSALVAFLDAEDRWNVPVTRALRSHAGTLVIPVAILSEVAHFIERDLGQHALRVFVDDIVTGSFSVDCGEQDWPRVLELVDRYADLELGLADAAVIACAERRKVPVATLDFRHFGAVAREGAIDLLPIAIRP